MSLLPCRPFESVDGFDFQNSFSAQYGMHSGGLPFGGLLCGTERAANVGQGLGKAFEHRSSVRSLFLDCPILSAVFTIGTRPRLHSH